MNMHTQIALPTTVADLIEEYQAKDAGLAGAIDALSQACTDLDTAATVAGRYVESNFSKPALYGSSIRKNLLKSGWSAVYDRLNVNEILSAQDRQLWKQTLASPPPLTMENAIATFKDYLVRPRFHILRGLAEVFCGLDPAYKSHSKVRIGVKGLPKRIILGGWGDFSSWGAERFRDLVNALAAVRNQPAMGYVSGYDHKAGQDYQFTYQQFEDGPQLDRGITLRRFHNGNAHVIFDKWALLDINRALGEFYGEVLPDAEPENVKPSASTAVSKDLQFYWSPAAVIEAALRFSEIHSRDGVSGSYRDNWTPPRVLEPSCGDGRILDALRAKGCDTLGFEYHPGRAAECKAKGHAVVCANFLEQPPTGDFDFVVMNPPFYGKHYAKHVRHALKFLKPGGRLVAILPATARYDHDELADLTDGPRKYRHNEQWQDLPVASFAEVGVNVPTVLLRLWRPSE